MNLNSKSKSKLHHPKHLKVGQITAVKSQIGPTQLTTPISVKPFLQSVKLETKSRILKMCYVVKQCHMHSQVQAKTAMLSVVTIPIGEEKAGLWIVLLCSNLYYSSARTTEQMHSCHQKTKHPQVHLCTLSMTWAGEACSLKVAVTWAETTIFSVGSWDPCHRCSCSCCESRLVIMLCRFEEGFLPVCAMEDRRRIVSWLAGLATSGADWAKDILTFKPCDLWPLIRERTIWVIGDSISQVVNVLWMNLSAAFSFVLITNGSLWLSW